MTTTTVTRGPSLAQPSLMDAPQPQQSLARVGATTIDVKPITDPRAFMVRLEQIRADFNVIAPAVQVMGDFTPGYALTAAIVTVNTAINDDGQGPETYSDKGFMKPNQRALNKVGLLKISTAAGVKWTPNTGRRDDGQTPYLWMYCAEGLVETADGGWQVISGEVEIDLRDGSPQIGGWTPEGWDRLIANNKGKKKDEQRWSINGWSDRRLMQARSMGARLAETKAKNRAIRSLGLQQVYTVDELKKPFLIFKAQYQPDLTDPEVRLLVAKRALFGMQALYPPSAATAPPAIAVTPLQTAPIPPAGTIDAETVDESATSPQARVVQTCEVSNASGALIVVRVDPVGVNHANNCEVFDVVLSDGRKGRTDDHHRVMAASQLGASKTPVAVTLRPSPRVEGVLILDDIVPDEPTASASAASTVLL